MNRCARWLMGCWLVGACSKVEVLWNNHTDAEPKPICEDELCIDSSGGWVGVAGSDMGSQSEFLVWGSASGGGLSNGSFANGANVAVDSQDRVVVGFVDRCAGSPCLRALRFDGAWHELSSLTTSGIDISLALDSEDRPVVAYVANVASSNRLYLRRYDNGAWGEVGAGSASAGGLGELATAALRGRFHLSSAGGGQILAAWDSPSGIYAKLFDGAAWVELAGSAAGVGLGAGSAPSAVFSPAGEAVVAFEQAGVHARIFDGTSWTALGSMFAGTNPLLALGGGDLWMAYSQGDTARLRRYSGSDWTDVAGSSSGLGDDDWGLGLTVDSGGNPWVASRSGSYTAGARHLEANAWVAAPEYVNTPGASQTTSQLALALGAAQDPVVAWIHQPTGVANEGSHLYAKRLSNGQWQGLGASTSRGGGISDDITTSRQPMLAFDANGRALVAWQSRDASCSFNKWQAKQFVEGTWAAPTTAPGSCPRFVAAGGGLYAFSSTGSGVLENGSWLALPALTQVQTLAAAPSTLVVLTTSAVVRLQSNAWLPLPTSPGATCLALGANNEVLVAGDDAGVPYVRRYNGSAWEDVAGLSATGSADSVAMAANGAGDVAVAWSEGANAQISTRRLVDGVWLDTGGFGYLSGALTNATLSLALDVHGYPVIAWEDVSFGNYEIYLRRFVGSAWIEVSGSASGGGISNSGGYSGQPSLAIHGDIACVAYVEAGASASEIVMRCASLQG